MGDTEAPSLIAAYIRERKHAPLLLLLSMFSMHPTMSGCMANYYVRHINIKGRNKKNRKRYAECSDFALTLINRKKLTIFLC